MTNTPISYGQIWREVDSRRVHHVRVEGETQHRIIIRTVILGPSGNTPAPGSRISYASKDRFNGKHGGYELVAGLGA